MSKLVATITPVASTTTAIAKHPLALFGGLTSPQGLTHCTKSSQEKGAMQQDKTRPSGGVMHNKAESSCLCNKEAEMGWP